jgi:hypothetical protein
MPPYMIVRSRTLSYVTGYDALGAGPAIAADSHRMPSNVHVALSRTAAENPNPPLVTRRLRAESQLAGARRGDGA